MARAKPREVDAELWAVIEPLLPKIERRMRHPGRRRHPDRLVFQGILFVLHTGIARDHLPQELGFGSGMTCWRRLAEWKESGVWPRLHEALLAVLPLLQAVPPIRGKRGRRLVWDLGVTQRWVVERAFARLHWFRRLRIRWEVCRRHPRGLPHSRMWTALLAAPERTPVGDSGSATKPRAARLHENLPTG